MPLFMDIHHHVEGLTADAVGHAHEADLKTQQKYGVKYLRYWFDEGTGKVFCLVEAPRPDAADAVHREAHGTLADSIIEDREGTYRGRRRAGRARASQRGPSPPGDIRPPRRNRATARGPPR